MKRWACSALLMLVACAVAWTPAYANKPKKPAVTAEPALPKKPKPGKPGKPALGKTGKHDLKELVNKRKAKAKAKRIGKVAPGSVDAVDGKSGAPADAPEPAASVVKKATGPKVNADKEDQKHIRRLAKVSRLEQIAKENNNEPLLAKVQLLRDKEVKRHERVVARINFKPVNENVPAN